MVVQLLSGVWLFVTPWTVARQASLSVTISRSLLRLMFIEWVMPSNHLILCHPFLLLPSIFPSIRVFSNKSSLCNRWPKYWSEDCPSGKQDLLFGKSQHFLLVYRGSLKLLSETIYPPDDSEGEFASKPTSSESLCHVSLVLVVQVFHLSTKELSMSVQIPNVASAICWNCYCFSKQLG